MRPIQCIIIEDELPARELLRSYVKELPDWHLAADFDNAIDAIGYLSQHHVDVLFLDIQLPKLSGISFLRTLARPPLVVITTAYSEHAVEAFELTVFDYLLKPYPFERFLRTVNRIAQHFQGAAKEALPPTQPVTPESPFLLIRSDRQNIKVPIADILFVESQKEYIRIVTAQGETRTRMGITKIETQLTPYEFLRIHRSYLVPRAKIATFTATTVTIGKHTLPIGRLYQREVREQLK